VEGETLECRVGREDGGGEDGTLDAGRRDDGEGFRQGAFPDTGNVLDGQYAFHDDTPYQFDAADSISPKCSFEKCQFQKEKEGQMGGELPGIIETICKMYPIF
jgi:hypothetical protein